MSNDEAFAYILGALRDGSICIDKMPGKYTNYQLGFQSVSKGWIQEIAKIIEYLYGVKPQFGKVAKSRPIYWRCRVSNKKIVTELLVDSGFVAPQREWVTPKQIMTAKTDVKRAYISGFFDAEGGFSRSSTNKAWNAGIWQAWNNNKRCPPLDDIESILESEGIETNRITVKEGRISPLFCLRITKKESLRKFCNFVSLLHPKKYGLQQRIIGLVHTKAP